MPVEFARWRFGIAPGSLPRSPFMSRNHRRKQRNKEKAAAQDTTPERDSKVGNPRWLWLVVLLCGGTGIGWLAFQARSAWLSDTSAGGSQAARPGQPTE